MLYSGSRKYEKTEETSTLHKQRRNVTINQQLGKFIVVGELLPDKQQVVIIGKTLEVN